jgi:hypothetical protein
VQPDAELDVVAADEQGRGRPTRSTSRSGKAKNHQAL